MSYTRGAAYGWRARIGLLQPGMISDTNPFEFYMMAPEGVELILTSMGLGGMSEANYERVIANLETPIKRVVSRKADAIIQTGIPPLVYHGWGIEEKLHDRVAQVTPTPYISDAAACIAGMHALGMARIAVVSAFDDDLVTLIRGYLKNAGIDLVGHQSVPREENGETGSLSLETVYRTAREVYQRHKPVDGIWITQASVPSVGVIEDLEHDLRVPVVTSAQALMWAGLGMAGVRQPVAGFGKLFGAPFNR
jgi:maleate isomerase